MFSIVALTTSALDTGRPGTSEINTILLLLLILAIPMIPYVILHRTWRPQETASSNRYARFVEIAQRPFHSMAAWMHMHHPHLLHR